MKLPTTLRLSMQMSFALLAIANFAYAGAGEITGFRYQSCTGEICISVSSPQGSLSTLQQDFTAIGTGTAEATLRILKNGKLRREFSGANIVSHLRASSISIDSERRLVLVNAKTGAFEIFDKSSAEKEIAR